MKILSCEINKVPVKTILDTITNCNIIGRGLVDVLGLEIDTSHKEEVKLLIRMGPQLDSINRNSQLATHNRNSMFFI